MSITCTPPSGGLGPSDRSPGGERLVARAALDRADVELHGTSEHVRALADAMAAVQVALVDAVTSWDADARWAWDGARRPEDWLAHRGGVSRVQAREVVAAARLCRRVPEVDAALHGTLALPPVEPGELDLLARLRHLPAVRLSVAQLAIWASVVTPAREALFAAQAARVLPGCAELSERDTRTAAARWAAIADDTLGAGQPPGPPPRATFDLAATGDGRHLPKGELDTDLAAVLRAAFDHLDRPDPDDHPGGPRSRTERWADHLGTLARRFLAGVDQPTADDSVSAPTTTVLVVTRPHDHGTGVTADGHVVTRPEVERYGCHQYLQAVVVDDRGELLALGRRRRLFTPGQTRAIVVRDGHCQFPGCDAPPSQCETHHVTHWEHGGPTDVGNGTLLCHHHHRLLHRNGWALTANPAPTGPRWLLDTSPVFRRTGRAADPPRPAARSGPPPSTGASP